MLCGSNTRECLYYQIVRSPNSLAEIYKTTQKFQDSKALLNQKFTSDRLKQELATNNYFIVHITLRCLNWRSPAEIKKRPK
jgi:hypothetical protein